MHDIKYIRKYLRLHKASGKIFWKISPSPNVRLGKEAGYISHSGYRKISIKNKNVYTHRIVWFLTKGFWPTFGLDHINGDTSDNRISNLREATQDKNLANSKLRKDNTSGHKGVWWHKQARKWAGCIGNGKGKHRGSFNTREEALAVYAEAAKAKYGEFANPI